MNDATRPEPIPGFPGYFAHRDGGIYSDKSGPIRRLAGFTDRHGYAQVALYGPKGRLVRGVHVLLALTFHGPKPTPAHVCRHLNGDRTDNRADNVAWGTSAQNAADAAQHGTASWLDVDQRGEKNRYAKLTEAQVLEIEQRVRAGETGRALAREFDVSHAHISHIKAHRCWRHLWNAA